jgi:hypothetical protein
VILSVLASLRLILLFSVLIVYRPDKAAPTRSTGLIGLRFRNPITGLDLCLIRDCLIELDKGVLLHCVLTDNKKPRRNIAIQGPKNSSDVSGRNLP